MVPMTRIVADRRLLVTVLAILAVANVIGLAIVFGPLRSRVNTLAQRADVASRSAASAAAEFATARQTSAGSEKATVDLQRFYTEILPIDQPAARRVTFVRLAQIARESNLSYDQRTFAQDKLDKEGVLSRASLTMSVYGTYRDIRRFIHRLETGDEFVVISQFGVSQSDPGEPLEAALTLATFFKASDGR